MARTQFRTQNCAIAIAIAIAVAFTVTAIANEEGCIFPKRQTVLQKIGTEIEKQENGQQPTGGDDFKLGAQSARFNRTVWMVLCRERREHEWMFLPIISTMKEAFQVTAGISMGVAFAQDEACLLETGVNENSKGGLMPVVIAMQWFLMRAKVKSCRPGERYVNFLERLNYVAYLIYYNDEPVARIGPDGSRLVQALLKGPRPRELWSYSWYIRSLIEDNLSSVNITSRSMPAGCAREMDFGVLAVPGAQPRNYSKVGFLGAWKHRPMDVQQTLRADFGDRIAAHNSANSLEALRIYLTTCPLLQINLHSLRNPTGQAMESFRMSLLLMNGACVISEHPHDLEEKHFEGFVRFENLSKFKVASSGLLDNPSAVAECNAQARRKFCTDWAPAKLLSDSGFLEEMRTMP